MRVSVICTVLNEGQAIRRLLDSLANQTRLPDEVVIVDGGSRDGTVAEISAYDDRLPLKILVRPGANISQGRNLAIQAATGDIIASTDAGVWLEPCWLDALIQPLVGDPNRQTVAGFFVPDATTPFELAMGATVLPAVGDVNPNTFLPSSRSVAFRKSAWVAAGGYPDWLDYCEDLIFDFKLRDVGGPYSWAPTALAHFRPRSSLKAYFKQYYRYARGDGKADLWRKRHAIRYMTYLIGAPGLLLLAWRRPGLALIGLLAGTFAYCNAPYRRLRRGLPGLDAVGRAQALALVPVIRVVGDVAKISGYPAGWIWRVRNWHRDEIHWR